MRHSTAPLLHTVGYTRRAARASASRSVATFMTATEEESASSEAPMSTASTGSTSESWLTGWWLSTTARTQTRSLAAHETERFPVAVTAVRALISRFVPFGYDPRPILRRASWRRPARADFLIPGTRRPISIPWTRPIKRPNAHDLLVS